MTIDLLTLSPEFFLTPLGEGIPGRGLKQGLIKIRVFNLRDFTEDRHRTVDDRPFGGGAGMVLKPEPIHRALTWLKKLPEPAPWVTVLTPQGSPLNQARVREQALHPRLVLLCGRYEGIDERITDFFCDEQLSIGDYVLSGGEPAALVLIDAMIRLIPGVMGCADSGREESFEEGLLEYPHYTRPRNFKGHRVPEVLFSGDHEQIRIWRRRQSLTKTLRRRPRLIAEGCWNPEDQKIIETLSLKE
jgi:tRNA (guanine37-N1)-methyltransferase